MTDFHKALLATIIPIAGLGVLSLVGRAVHPFFYLWFVAVGLEALAILLAIAFAIFGKSRTAAGIITGVGLGIVALSLTCFANLSGGRF
ncbi:MAG: hypothetical protein HY673_00480 [Chloroflexi bacterium]|nr:hypothetical protein [Chloroflexota bacterium]